MAGKAKKGADGVPTDDEIAAGFAERTQDAPPIGMGPGGQLTQVAEDAEPIQPDIVDEDAFEDGYEDLEDDLGDVEG